MKAFMKTFLISSSIVCLGFFARALNEGAINNLRNGMLFTATFGTYLWFLVRYYYLLIAGFEDQLSNWILNFLVVLVGIYTIHLYNDAEKWFLAVSFLMAMAAWKDTQVVTLWRHNSEKQAEVNYHRQARLYDGGSALLLFYLYQGLKEQVFQQASRDVVIYIFSTTWCLGTLLATYEKGRAVNTILKTRRTKKQSEKQS